MRTKRAVGWFVVPAVVAATVAVSAGTALANHHLIQIREVFAGTSDHPAAQYVELQMYGNGQNILTNRRVEVFDASNVEVDEFVFTSNPPVGTNQSSVLLATAEAQTLFGVTADLTMDAAAIPLAGGKVCFVGSATFGVIDCVSYGNYSGPPTGGSDPDDDTGDPFSPAEGLLQGAAMLRDISGGANANALEAADDTNDSADDFDFAAPAPRNNAGVTGSAPGGTLSFSAATVTVGEGVGDAVVRVNRNGGAGTVSVDYSTADGGALAGSDYTATSGTLTFGPSDTSLTFEVPIVNDTRDESPQGLRLRLRNPTGGAMLGIPLDATLLINDNDPAPTISVGDRVIIEGDSGTKLMRFTLTLSAASEKTIKVTFTTSDGSALAGQDYVAKSARITFLPNTTTKVVSVQIIGDLAPEPQETFTVTLTLPSNVTLGDAVGVGTINDND